jgi:Leucine-rich repeat (LRR) protein
MINDQNNNESTDLDLKKLNLTSLPDLSTYTHLLVLQCTFNQLTVLPTLPKTLQELYCYSNNITQLPELPDSLQILFCGNNALTTLPKLPYNLIRLSCANNYLTHLPKLPPKMQTLNCSHNQLTCLPKLPYYLDTLNCENNQLRRLPTLPPHILDICCDYNDLYHLPIIPPGYETLKYFNNPVSEFINTDDEDGWDFDIQIDVFNRFVFTYHCLKLKHKFRKWLWVNVRLPKIQEEYRPENIAHILYAQIENDM